VTAADRAPLRRPARTWLAAGLSGAVLGLAVTAGLRSSALSLGPLITIETLSAHASGVLLALGAAAPLGYAFLAGMVASVNPCGFVLLPTYLTYYIGDRRDAAGIRQVTGRALAVSLTMTAGFVLLFGLAGIVAASAASALASALPWLGTAVGVSLIAVGGLLASGRALDFPLAPRAAQRLRTATRNPGLGGYLAYGLAYALASLGCTLPVFLSVVGTSLRLHGLADAVWQFLLFGLGMGVIITVLTIITAWFGDGVIRRVRVIGRHIGWASAVMLWLAGAYVIYYWLTTTRLL
jgi:cytochrome c biogenesis protein CcdA